MVSLHRLSSLAITLVVASPLCAQQRDTLYQMSPVIVTATQARERETPATFTDLAPSQIRERYSVQDIPVLLSELPSVTSYSENGNGIGYNYVTLRGFEQRRISVMINGVPQNDPEDHSVYWIDFPDLMASVDNVQMQRGAGSAFYGPPAIGGSINLVTNPFGGDPGIVLESYFGFQQFSDSSRSLAENTRRLSASFTSGLVGGQYMLYGRLGNISSDGYRQGSWVDLHSYFFGAMRVDPTMTTRFHFFGGPLTDGLAYSGLPKSAGGSPTLRRQNLASWVEDSVGVVKGFPRRPQESEYFNQPHYEFIHEWRLSPGVTLHNTLFYYSGEGYYDYDASWADTSTLRLGSAYGIPVAGNPGNALVRAFVGNTQWGWLPRVDFDHGTGVLTLGAEMRFHRSTHWGKISYAENLPAGFDPDYHFYEYHGARDIISLYGNELYHIADNVGVMGSVQFVWNRYGINNEKFLGTTFSVPYFFVNPKAGINVNLTESLSSYLSLAYTSREPTMRNLYAAEDAYFGATPQFKADTSGGRVRYDFGNPLAKPERLMDLEAGARYATAASQAGVTLFWMEFSDELIKSGQVDIFGQPVTGNASRTRHVGVELEGHVSLPFGFSIGGNFSQSWNRLVRYSVIGDDGGMKVLDGNAIAGFPDRMGNLRFSYRSSRFVGSWIVKYVGPLYTDNFMLAAHRNDAYVVCNLELLHTFPLFAGGSLELRGEMRNVLNSLYFMSGEGDAFFPAAERNFVVGARLKI